MIQFAEYIMLWVHMQNKLIIILRSSVLRTKEIFLEFITADIKASLYGFQCECNAY